MRSRVEDVPVEEVDGFDDTSTRTVEVGTPRRRGRELLLVAVALAVLVGVGLIGDDGAGEAETAPTTSTTERRTTTTRRTTSSTRPTTTTTYPQYLTGSGRPLLPEATGTTIAVLEGDGVVSIIDLDSGDTCRTLPSGDGAWFPWPGALDVDQLLLQTGTSLLVVDDRCNHRELGVGLGGRWIAAITDGAVWLGYGDSSQRLVEVSLATGEETGREIDLPANTGAAVVAVGDGLVVSLAGEMTLVEPSGRRRDLGTGTPLGGTDDVVLFLTCPELRCGLGVLDVDSGRRRVLDMVPAAWEPVAFSPDGRLARILISDGSGATPRPALVDLERLTVRDVETSMQQSVFSADGRWLIGHHGSSVVAVDVEQRGQVMMLPIDVDGIQNLVRVRRP